MRYCCINCQYFWVEHLVIGNRLRSYCYSFHFMLIIIQVRLESIEAVNKIVEEANKRIQPTGTGTVISYSILLYFWTDWDGLHFSASCMCLPARLLIINGLYLSSRGIIWCFKGPSVWQQQKSSYGNFDNYWYCCICNGTSCWEGKQGLWTPPQKY